MPNSVSDELYADLQAKTALGSVSIERMGRAYWLSKLALTESALLSVNDARYQYLTGPGSVADRYYAWLATQPGGNFVGSLADRLLAARVAGALP